MSDSDEGDVDYFAVYITAPSSASISPHSLISALETISTPEDSPLRVIPDSTFTGLSGQRVIAYHLNIEYPKRRTHRNYIIVADRVLSEGVLVVNLKPYHGHIDAIRMPAVEAGDAVASMNIGNTDWYECRDAYGPQHTDERKIREERFALYNMLPKRWAKEFERALKWMNDGVGEMGLEDVDDEKEERELPIGLQRSLYRPLSVKAGMTVEEILAVHASRAGELDLDPNFLTIVDSEWETRGVMIVRIGVAGRREILRCKTPIAGEILNFVFIGLMTWEEAEWQYANIAP